jgi:hypothetical protein
MTRSCCPSCRLRFSRVTATTLRHCPFCAGPVAQVSAADLVGFRLVAVDDLMTDEPAMPVAVAVALPVPPKL